MLIMNFLDLKYKNFLLKPINLFFFIQLSSVLTYVPLVIPSESLLGPMYTTVGLDLVNVVIVTLTSLFYLSNSISKNYYIYIVGLFCVIF